MDLEPVPDEHALMADDILVVADLHIGIEEELHEKGIRVPSRAEVMGRKLVELADRRGASRLVILGDVKHLVPKMASRERRDVYVFFRDLAPRFREVYIAQGNHDGMLKNIVPRSVRFKPAYGFRIEDVGFCHGHAWPYKKVMEGSVLLMGHNHPAAAFRDALGSRQIVPCWMRVPFLRKHKRYPKLPKEAIVVPSFNDLCGGMPVNDVRARFIGPLFAEDLVRVEDASVHLLDGTNLGRLRDIRVDLGFRPEDYRQRGTERDAVEVAAGSPADCGTRSPVVAVDFHGDGRSPRTSPLRRRNSGSGPDGDAPRPAPLLHFPGRVARGLDGVGVVFRPISPADRCARTRRDRVHGPFGGGCARSIPCARRDPSTEAVDSALRRGEWARSESNRRPRLCKSRIIATRLRARGTKGRGPIKASRSAQSKSFAAACANREIAASRSETTRSGGTTSTTMARRPISWMTTVASSDSRRTRCGAVWPSSVAAVIPAPRIAAHMIENVSCETFRGSSAATIPPSRLTTATASAFVTSRSARTMSAKAVTPRPPVRKRIRDRPCSRTPLPPGALGVSSSPQGASRESREADGTSPRPPRASPRSSRAPSRPSP